MPVRLAAHIVTALFWYDPANRRFALCRPNFSFSCPQDTPPTPIRASASSGRTYLFQPTARYFAVRLTLHRPASLPAVREKRTHSSTAFPRFYHTVRIYATPHALNSLRYTPPRLAARPAILAFSIHDLPLIPVSPLFSASSLCTPDVLFSFARPPACPLAARCPSSAASPYTAFVYSRPPTGLRFAVGLPFRPSRTVRSALGLYSASPFAIKIITQ